MSLGGKLMEKLMEKLAGPVGFLILKELGRIAVAVERGVDSLREIHGLHPVFAALEKQPAAPPAGESLDSVLDPPEDLGDYLRLDILEALAREHQIPITTETDLVALGKTHGWLDQAGQVAMLPRGYGD